MRGSQDARCTDIALDVRAAAIACASCYTRLLPILLITVRLNMMTVRRRCLAPIRFKVRVEKGAGRNLECQDPS